MNHPAFIRYFAGNFLMFNVNGMMLNTLYRVITPPLDKRNFREAEIFFKVKYTGNWKLNTPPWIRKFLSRGRGGVITRHKVNILAESPKHTLQDPRFIATDVAFLATLSTAVDQSTTAKNTLFVAWIRYQKREFLIFVHFFKSYACNRIMIMMFFQVLG